VQPGEAGEVAGLREEGAGGAPRRRPAVLVPGALHAADDGEPPALRVGALVAQALERNAQLDLEAVVGEPPLRLEDEVGVDVRRLAPDRRKPARALEHRPVALHA
jgi:hypothetical protein